MPGRSDYNAYIQSDGTISYNFPTILQSICKMEIWHFPLDRQTCRLEFSSWSYGGNELDIYPLRSTGTFKSAHLNSIHCNMI